MSLLVLLALMVLAAAVPDLCPSVLSIHRHPPDLWVAAVLYLALRARGFKAVGWAVVVGLARDAVSLDPLGTHAFVLGTTAFIFAEGRVPRGRIEGATRLALLALGTLVAGWLYLLRLLPMDAGALSFGAFVDVVPVVLWTTVLASGLFPMLDRYGLLDELCGRTHAFSS